MLLNPLIKNDKTKAARRRCKRKFIYYFKNGYRDQKYIEWERQYKLDAHLRFQVDLNKTDYKGMIANEAFEKIATLIVRIESKTNLLFSFEKMALRDALKFPGAAKSFTIGLFNYIYGKESLQKRFEHFVEVVAGLPRKQTRVLTWPLVTVFGFIADPSEHMFLKPRVTQEAAKKYRYPFEYKAHPNWKTYQSLLAFSNKIWNDTKAYHPRDNIDTQSFIWVMGSEEYPD